MNKIALITAIMLSLGLILISNNILSKNPKFPETIIPTPQLIPESSPTLLPSPTLTPIPSPKPLTFAEMNQLYGPCVKIPVLYYHHIQSEAEAKKKNQSGLSVFTDVFEQQMTYLKNKGYTIVPTEKIPDYWNGESLQSKPVILTFDDAYDDFYTDAYPILKKFHYPATMFVSTGLVNNPGYLSQTQIQELANTGQIYFGNHTWSHSSMKKPAVEDEHEISLANTQLQNLRLNHKLIFAYPYGEVSQSAIKILEKMSYSMAFTTKYGTTQCKKLAMQLPRVRIANQPLAKYGL